MGTVLMGVERFFEIWAALAVALIEKYDPPWDFNEGTVKGKMKDILEGDSALEFVTYARRARKNGVFRRGDFVKDAIRAELKLHKRPQTELSADARRMATNRLNNSVNDSVDTFIHYGLFAKTAVKHDYTLTDEGNKIYDKLDEADLPPASGDPD